MGGDGLCKISVSCGNVVYENGVQKLLLTEAGYLTPADRRKALIRTAAPPL